MYLPTNGFGETKTVKLDKTLGVRILKLTEFFKLISHIERLGPQKKL